MEGAEGPPCGGARFVYTTLMQHDAEPVRMSFNDFVKNCMAKAEAIRRAYAPHVDALLAPPLVTDGGQTAPPLSLAIVLGGDCVMRDPCAPGDSVIYPGTGELIERLHARGCDVLVVSRRPAVYDAVCELLKRGVVCDVRAGSLTPWWRADEGERPDDDDVESCPSASTLVADMLRLRRTPSEPYEAIFYFDNDTENLRDVTEHNGLWFPYCGAVVRATVAEEDRDGFQTHVLERALAHYAGLSSPPGTE